MTSLSLLLWIASGVVLQLAIYLAIGFWRHWQDYQSLRIRAVAKTTMTTTMTEHLGP